MEPLTIAALASGVGQVGGGVMGYFGGKAERRERRRALEEQRRLSEAAYQDMQAMYDPYRTATAGSIGELAQGIRSGRWDVAPEQFSYGKSAQDFLDPSLQFQQQEAQRALAAQYGGAGGLYSGAAMKALQDRTQQIASTGYNTAFEQMMRDKDFAYRQFGDEFAAKRQRAMDDYGRLQNLVNIGSSTTANLANLRQGQAASAMNIAGQSGQIAGQEARAPYDMLGGLFQVGGQTAKDYYNAGGTFGQGPSTTPKQGTF